MTTPSPRIASAVAMPTSAADVQPVAPAERPGGGEHHVVSVHESAGRAATSLHLNNGWRGGGNGVSQLIRECREKVGGHVAIVAVRRRRANHPIGYDTGRK